MVIFFLENNYDIYNYLMFILLYIFLLGRGSEGAILNFGQHFWFYWLFCIFRVSRLLLWCDFGILQLIIKKKCISNTKQQHRKFLMRTSYVHLTSETSFHLKTLRNIPSQSDVFKTGLSLFFKNISLIMVIIFLWNVLDFVTFNSTKNIIFTEVCVFEIVKM